MTIRHYIPHQRDARPADSGSTKTEANRVRKLADLERFARHCRFIPATLYSLLKKTAQGVKFQLPGLRFPARKWKQCDGYKLEVA